MNYKTARISTSFDTGRMGEAMSRPGIDPRCWVSLAVIEDIAIDPAEGIFADVYTMPGRQTITARVMSPYIGDGYGLFFPLKVGDEVLIGWPSGDPMMGVCILGRLFSPADKPSLEFAKDPTNVTTALPETLDTTNDIVLVVEPGQKIRVRTSNSATENELTFSGDEFRVVLRGDSTAVIKTEDNAKVYLGDEPANTQPLALGQGLEDYMGAASTIPGRGGLLGYLCRLAIAVGFPEQAPSYPSSVKSTKVEGK